MVVSDRFFVKFIIFSKIICFHEYKESWDAGAFLFFDEIAKFICFCTFANFMVPEIICFCTFLEFITPKVICFCTFLDFTIHKVICFCTFLGSMMRKVMCFCTFLGFMMHKVICFHTPLALMMIKIKCFYTQSGVVVIKVVCFYTYTQTVSWCFPYTFILYIFIYSIIFHIYKAASPAWPGRVHYSIIFVFSFFCSIFSFFLLFSCLFTLFLHIKMGLTWKNVFLTKNISSKSSTAQVYFFSGRRAA